MELLSRYVGLFRVEVVMLGSSWPLRILDVLFINIREEIINNKNKYLVYKPFNKQLYRLSFQGGNLQ